MIKRILSVGSFFLLMSASLSAQKVDYPTQIQPIFNARCTNCHGSSGSLSLESHSAVMAGSFRGAVVVPGNANGSILYNKIRLDQAPPFGSRMPQGGQLPQAQIDLIRDWINQGATATDAEKQTIAGRFTLEGNYPNPFNPGTTVVFSSPVQGRLTLTVYDLLGRPVMQRALIAAAGENRVGIDLSGQATGRYLYRITGELAGGQRIDRTGSMMLVK